MKYDKIRGKSVSECMMKLRSQYGNAAIILSTREVKEGGVLGSGILSKKMYEIDFMVEEKQDRSSRKVPSFGSITTPPPLPDEREKPKESVRREPAEGRSTREGGAKTGSGYSRNEGEESSTSSERTRSSSRRMEPDLQEESGEDVAALLRHLNQRVSTLHRELPEGEKPLAPLVEEERKREEEPAGESALASEEESLPLARTTIVTDADYSRDEIKALLSFKEEQPDETPSWKEEEREEDRSVRVFHQIRNRLLGAQLSREFTDTFLRKLDHSLSLLEKNEYRQVEKRTLESLSSMIQTVPSIAPRRGECLAVMLVGPTGSGKTTSVAKLAARYHLMEQREVSLYSLDHYRLAATEQLKTYASVMGVPFHSPLTPDEFRESLRRDGAEIMLIDTSGIGHNDLHRMQDLKKFVEACEVRLEKHLVLAANTSPLLVEKILLAYDSLGFDKIILTKLDETEFIGAFIEHADKFNRPFSYLMNGQEVPGDIQEAGAREMAEMIFKKELPGVKF